MQMMNPTQGDFIRSAIPMIVKHPTGQAVLEKMAIELFGLETLVTKVEYSIKDGVFNFDIRFLKTEYHAMKGKVIWEICITAQDINYHKHIQPSYYDAYGYKASTYNGDTYYYAPMKYSKLGWY